MNIVDKKCIDFAGQANIIFNASIVTLNGLMLGPGIANRDGQTAYFWKIKGSYIVGSVNSYDSNQAFRVVIVVDSQSNMGAPNYYDVFQSNYLNTDQQRDTGSRFKFLYDRISTLGMIGYDGKRGTIVEEFNLKFKEPIVTQYIDGASTGTYLDISKNAIFMIIFGQETYATHGYLGTFYVRCTFTDVNVK